MSSQKKGERKCFKNILSDEQRFALEQYFVKVKQKPLRKEKKELSERLNIDPYDLNKWFQARRNKESKMKTTLSVSSISTKVDSRIDKEVQKGIRSHIDKPIHKIQTSENRISKRRLIHQPVRSVHFSV